MLAIIALLSSPQTGNITYLRAEGLLVRIRTPRFIGSFSVVCEDISKARFAFELSIAGSDEVVEPRKYFLKYGCFRNKELGG